ncbi:MAG TPA: N-methyl-L-tryptophan oxidase, partial [Chthoniobacterales bacterium]
MHYDVAVLGLGGIGSAVLAHCASRGAKAIGLEQFARGHQLGSSTGRSRMIRKAYFEDPAYVPRVLRAYKLWHELERDAGEEFLRVTGVLTVGEDTSEIIEGTRRAASEHGLAIAPLSRSEVEQRYPTLRLLPDEVAIFEKDAGVLWPERATDAHLNKASAAGATVCFETAVRSWRTAADGCEISLSNGDRVNAAKLVIATGPWMQQQLQEFGVDLRIQRNVQAWFAPATDAYQASRFPAFLLNRRGLPAPLYGFPDFGDGVKIAFHGHGDLTTADEIDRAIDEERDIEPLIRATEAWMPEATANLLAAKPCMYSLTRDEHFVVDRHPVHENVVICGGFSGHGFKFASVIGEIAADLALNGGTQHAIGFLSLSRFGS